MEKYHLTMEKGRWKLERKPGGVAMLFSSLEDALTACAAFVGEREGSLKVHGGDGAVMVERRYPRMLDPAEAPC